MNTLPSPSTVSPVKRSRPASSATWSGECPGVAIASNGPARLPSPRRVTPTPARSASAGAPSEWSWWSCVRTIPATSPPAAASTASRWPSSSGPGSTTQPPTTYVLVPSSVSGEGFGARTRSTPSGIRVPSVMASDYLTRPAVEQAEAVRNGEVSSRALVEESLHAIHDLNEEINAFVTTIAERALAEADAVQPGDSRPLAGVPIAIKDLIAMTEGVRTTQGMEAMGDWVPATDSATVRKLRAAGAIVVGKTNTPELGILPVTEPDRF